MAEAEETALGGMTAIMDYCRTISMQCSESTIISLIKEEEFPATKVKGQWMSDKLLIKDWRINRIKKSVNQLSDTRQKRTPVNDKSPQKAVEGMPQNKRRNGAKKNT